MDAASDLANRYVAVWSEPDPERRRQAIVRLWAADGVHYVGTREARGYEALELRVKGSYEKNVRDAGNRFRIVGDVKTLRDAVAFHWEMLPANGDAVLATGLEVLLVDGHCQILVDYQFILT
jgi:hypothetical protein